MTSCSVSQKSRYRTGSGPHVPSETSRDTDHLRPSNLAAKTLHSVVHTRSKFGHDPCPVGQGLVAAVKCCVRKARFFRCPGTEQAKPEPCAGFNTTMRKTCLFSVFRSHNCRPKRDDGLISLFLFNFFPHGYVQSVQSNMSILFSAITFEILRTKKKIDPSHDRQGRGNHIPLFFSLDENQVVGDREKCTPKSGKNQPQKVSFWTKH